MLVYLLIAAVFPAMILGYPIISCGPGVNEVIAVRVPGCETTPCHVNQGGLIPFQFDFLAGGDSANLTLEVQTTVFGQTTIVPLPPEMVAACNGLINASCPVTIHQPLTYGGVFPVTTELHSGIPVRLRFEIRHVGEICACAVMNIVVH